MGKVESWRDSAHLALHVWAISHYCSMQRVGRRTIVLNVSQKLGEQEDHLVRENFKVGLKIHQGIEGNVKDFFLNWCGP